MSGRSKVRVIKDTFTPQLLNKPPKCEECINKYKKFWITILKLTSFGYTVPNENDYKYFLRKRDLIFSGSLMHKNFYLLYKTEINDDEENQDQGINEIPHNEPFPISIDADRIVIIENFGRSENFMVKLYIACEDKKNTKKYIYVKILPILWSIDDKFEISIQRLVLMSAHSFKFTIDKNETIKISDRFDEVDLIGFLLDNTDFIEGS